MVCKSVRENMKKRQGEGKPRVVLTSVPIIYHHPKSTPSYTHTHRLITALWYSPQCSESHLHVQGKNYPTPTIAYTHLHVHTHCLADNQYIFTLEKVKPPIHVAVNGCSIGQHE